MSFTFRKQISQLYYYKNFYIKDNFFNRLAMDFCDQDTGHCHYRNHRRYHSQQNWHGEGHGFEGKGHRYEIRGQRQYKTFWKDNGIGPNGEQEKPPPGLKGREIGMWHARRQKVKATVKLKEIEQGQEVKMAVDQKRDITKILQDMRSSRDCLPQSSRTGDCNVAEIDQSVENDVSSVISPVKEVMRSIEEDGFPFTDQSGFQVTLPDDNSRDSEALNKVLLEDFEEKQENNDYRAMQKYRQRLPSHSQRQTIIDLISSNQVVVLSGETGCGKTTQIPQYILDDFITRGMGSQCRIVCTQPRRISTISMAERVAAERAEKCGFSVGYLIRLENKLPRNHGSILYCTTGILLKFLEDDPSLRSVSHIILDEIHERDLLSDFLIIILKDIIKRQPELKVLLMSATLNAKAFSEYYGNCPMVHIPGFTYPVQEYFLEDVIELLRYKTPLQKVLNAQEGVGLEHKYSRSTIDTIRCMDFKKVDTDLVKQLICHIITTKGDGAILVFLPGWTEISNLHKMLVKDRMFSSMSVRIIPLHSMLPTLNQREVFDRPPPGVRKIIIATNIAETSITIDDIVFVIDCGKIKVNGFRPESNLATLNSDMVARANARQRRGRAGRVQPGVCYHLYTQLQESQMLDYLPPEILRTRLEELCLQIKFLKLGEIVPFVSKAMQPPSLAALKSAIQLLQDLNVLDKNENLLPLGKHLARMPLDPQTGKMILFGAMFSCLDPILTIAACLSFKDPFFLPLNKEAKANTKRMQLAEGCCSDHVLLVKAYQSWEKAHKEGYSHDFCWENFLSESNLLMLKKIRGQLAEILQELGFLRFKNPTQVNANKNSENFALVKAIVCAGLYPNVARITAWPTKYRSLRFVTKGEEKSELHPKSVVKALDSKHQDSFVVYHKKLKTSSVYIHDCSPVSPYSLLFFGGEIVERETQDGDGMVTVSVDDWIRFKAPLEIITLVKELRQELDCVLDQKICNTTTTKWGAKSTEGVLIKAIVDLVTKDDMKKTFAQ